MYLISAREDVFCRERCLGSTVNEMVVLKLFTFIKFDNHLHRRGALWHPSGIVLERKKQRYIEEGEKNSLEFLQMIHLLPGLERPVSPQFLPQSK